MEPSSSRKITSPVVWSHSWITDAPGGIWGALAEQLGKSDQFARYISPLLSAPGPEAWKQMLGNEPLVIFLKNYRVIWNTPSLYQLVVRIWELSRRQPWQTCL